MRRPSNRRMHAANSFAYGFQLEPDVPVVVLPKLRRTGSGAAGVSKVAAGRPGAVVESTARFSSSVEEIPEGPVTGSIMEFMVSIDFC
jgi:hypothetical protein